MVCNTLPTICSPGSKSCAWVLQKIARLHHGTITVMSLPEDYFHLLSFHSSNYGYTKILYIDSCISKLHVALYQTFKTLKVDTVLSEMSNVP
jgi:hypothetical protein